MKVADLLTDETKWVKRVPIMGERACLATAIDLVSGNREQAREVVAVLFPNRGGEGCEIGCIACFNDHLDTTFEDVMRVVKVAGI